MEKMFRLEKWNKKVCLRAWLWCFAMLLCTLMTRSSHAQAGDGSTQPTGKEAQVTGLQYRRPDEPPSAYANVSGPLTVLKGTSVIFRAVKDDTNKSWPDNKPSWSGSSGASGTGETKSVTFNTLSSSTSDFKTVIAKGYNDSSATANVVVCDIKPDTKAIEQFDGRSESSYGIGEAVELRPNFVPTGSSFNLEWEVVTGLGGIFDSTYYAEYSGGSVTMRARVSDGLSKGKYSTSISRLIVTPTDAIMRREAGTVNFHRRSLASTGFEGQAFIKSSTVSFSAIQVREYESIGQGTGYFDCGPPTATNPNRQPCDAHPTRPWVSVSKPEDASLGSIVDATDHIQTKLNYKTPFADGTFLWPIQWQWSITDDLFLELPPFSGELKRDSFVVFSRTPPDSGS